MGLIHEMFKCCLILVTICAVISLDIEVSDKNPTGNEPKLKADTTSKFQFEKENYTIQVTTDKRGPIEHFKTKPNSTNVVYELIINGSKEIKNSMELEKLTGILKITHELAAGNYSFEVAASRNNETCRAKVKLTVDEKPVVPKDSFKFEKDEYNIKVFSDQSGEVEHFKTNPETKDVVYALIIDEKHSWKTSLKLDNSTGVLKITHALTAGEYAFEVSAEKGKDNCKANVKLAVTTRAPLKFEKEEYTIKMYNDQTGVIEQFKTKPGLSNVEYELVIDMQLTLRDSLDLDKSTGVLKIIHEMTAGVYEFEVLAKQDKDKGQVRAKLIVIEVAVCKDNRNSPFSYTFLKILAKEKSKDTVFTASKIGLQCEYFLNNQLPQGEFFTLDKNTGVLMTNNIDSQNEAFKHQIQPHIKFEMIAECKQRTKRHSNDSNIMKILPERKNSIIQPVARWSFESSADSSKGESDKEQVEDTSCTKKKIKETCDSMMDNVVYNPTTIHILVIVQKSSDNIPEFLEKLYFMGYPEKKFVPQITPESIGHIQLATEENTEDIKYSVNNTREVTIDPCTGVLYPSYARFTYKPLEFDVIATHKNEKGNVVTNKTVPVKMGILQGHHIMKLLVKRRKPHSGLDVITKLEESMSATVKVLRKATMASMQEMSGSVEINTEGFDILEYLVVYAFQKDQFLDMNKQVTYVKNNKDLKDIVIWTNVLAGTPSHYYQSKGFISMLVVLMLALCMGSLIFYMTYIRTGKYYRCLNYFKRTRTNTTTPLDADQVSTGTSDYVVSFARMSHENPSFNVMEVEPRTKDMFTPITLKAYESSTSPQVINVDELAPPPPILVNSNNSSRRNSIGGEEALGLPVNGEIRVRRKSTVSFNEIVEQFHTIPKD